MTPAEYWQESLETVLDEMGLFHLAEMLTPEQRSEIGKALAASHENYGMAFYSPPSTDRIAALERGWRAKFAAAEADAERYRRTAEATVKRILRQNDDANISINNDGEVIRWGGRMERIA